MTELKTLKDIFDLETTDKNNVHPYWYSIQTENFMEDLKAEAVKWVKEDMNSKGGMIMDEYIDGRIEAMMEFFNLTEEDLQ